MKLLVMFSRIYKAAGIFLALLLISVITNAQDYESLSGYNEMTSLKKLVLGIADSKEYEKSELEVLKNIDFEMYVEREILIERWMHDKDLWIHGGNEKHESISVEDWMYKNGAWDLIDSDLGFLQKPEPEPEIRLASWMYADEFMQSNSNDNRSSKLEEWMSNRSYWVMKN